MKRLPQAGKDEQLEYVEDLFHTTKTTMIMMLLLIITIMMLMLITESLKEMMTVIGFWRHFVILKDLVNFVPISMSQQENVQKSYMINWNKFKRKLKIILIVNFTTLIRNRVISLYVTESRIHINS